MARDTLTKVAAKASAKSAGALHTFRAAAAELEEATRLHTEVRVNAESVARTHQEIAEEHAAQAQQSAEAAAKLRELVGGGQ